MSPISCTPRSLAYARSAPHSRSKRTWSATAPSPAKRSQPSIQYACRSRNSSSSALVTRARGFSSSSADVFRDGHDKLRAVVRYRGPGSRTWREAEMLPIDAHIDGVRWQGDFPVDEMGHWEYSIQAWTDVFGTWRDELQRKVNAGQTD